MQSYADIVGIAIAIEATKLVASSISFQTKGTCTPQGRGSEILLGAFPKMSMESMI